MDLDYYKDDNIPEVPQCSAINVAASEGISTVRTSVLPNTRCPIPYYIGADRADVSEAVTSSGHRSRFSASLFIILLSVLATCWLGSPRPSQGFDLCKASESTTQQREDAPNHRCWQISWLPDTGKFLQALSTAVALLLLFSAITSTHCCCWCTRLFRRVIKKPVRTLKCQLVMMLLLIRNYNLIRIRDLTPLTRTEAQPQRSGPSSLLRLLVLRASRTYYLRIITNCWPLLKRCRCWWREFRSAVHFGFVMVQIVGICAGQAHWWRTDGTPSNKRRRRDAGVSERFRMGLITLIGT